MKISWDDAFEKNGVIIDIRDKESYLKGHVPGSVFIFSSDLIYHHDKYLNFHDSYFLYCDYGSISDDVSRRLSILGYHVFSIIGGYQNYLLR